MQANLPLAPLCKRKVMCHQHQRRMLGTMQIEHEIDDPFTCHGIKAARGLVGEQKGRMHHERAGKRDTLLFTSGKRRRIVIEAMCETNLVKHRDGAVPGVAACQFEGKHHVFERGQVWQQLKRLEYEADHGGAHCGAPVLVQLKNGLPA